jgi:hypothetical protein
MEGNHNVHITEGKGAGVLEVGEHNFWGTGKFPVFLRDQVKAKKIT